VSALFSTTPVEGWGAFCAEPAKLTWVMWVVQIPAFPRVDSVTTNTVSIMLYANKIIQVRKPNASNACTSRHRVSTGEMNLRLQFVFPKMLAVEPPTAIHIIQRNQVQPNSAATMEGIAPLRLRERKSITGRVQKVRMAVAMPRAANEKYPPPNFVVVKFVMAAPRASSRSAKTVAVTKTAARTTGKLTMLN